MNCEVWRQAVPVGRFVDYLPGDARRLVLEHIRDCAECRQLAIAEDSSLVFESLPHIEVTQDEIDRIRTSVRTLRRVKDLERSTSWGRLTGGVAAIAALFLVALLLDPRRPDELAEETPFAGALGVGAGQLELGGEVRRAESSLPEPTDPSPTLLDALGAEAEIDPESEIEEEFVSSTDHESD